MRFVLAGASGFLGTTLARDLTRDGHQVVRLVRREPAREDEIRWNPAAGELDAGVLEGADVVYNLAGANIGRPWTPKFKKVIRESRVTTTATLANAIVRSGSRPVFLTQSGISAYGEDRGDEVLTEESSSGKGFLAEVCRLWEGATAPAAEAGARVCAMRTVPVIAREATIFRLMALPFRLGFGGRTGSGKQYFPVISLPDWLRAVRFVVSHEEVVGAVNMCMPDPPTNAEFTRALATALHRPALVPLPGFVLRAATGDLAWEVLGSHRSQPAKLLAAGFTFEHPTIDAIIATAV